MFSSRSFMVSGLTFKSLGIFRVNFCVQSKIVPLLHSFICGCSIFPTLFIEETLISPLYIFLALFFINELNIYMSGFISGLSILFH